ncbi:MAG TPA: conjugal transfer protein TrbD [Ramlibacter sp.]|nr:conjugal transfer protein TrbD [Ramlibacter sp.]
MKEPRRIPFHSSLNRSHLLLGGERTLVMMTGLTVITLVFSAGFQLYAVMLGAALWAVAHALLVKLAKADPDMSRIYQRHLQYRPYYMPRGCVHAVLLPEKRSAL